MTKVADFNIKITGKIENTRYIVGFDLLGNLDKQDILQKDFAGIILIADETANRIYGQKVLNSLKIIIPKIIKIIIPSGEKNKTFKELERIIGILIKSGVTRKYCVLTLGGGVTGDIGGFAASILFRGIPVIHLPTTLLAQIDASLGGKSGVDFWVDEETMYKNMLGKIDQPLAVVTDVDVLKSLPKSEILSGLGEMVKYFIGFNKPTLKDLLILSSNLSDFKKAADIIAKTQKMKLAIVQKDPLDKSGEREKLNLGHTIGHGIESAGEGKLSHGQSVAIGIHAAALISHSLGILNQKSYQKIRKSIEILSLPLYANNLKREKIQNALKLDKKCGTFVLIKDIGSLITGVSVENKIINKVLDEIIIN